MADIQRNVAPIVAVAYLLRGADLCWSFSAERFLNSYLAMDAGMPHSAYLLLKGFDSAQERQKAAGRFTRHGFSVFELDDDGFDIGAYIRCASRVSSEYIGFFSAHSELLGRGWLAKFMNNVLLNNMSVVSASASYESLSSVSSVFPGFPNPHLRSNAFFIARGRFLSYTSGLVLKQKEQTYAFESGTFGLTRMVLQDGGAVGLVGRDGRAYRPERWPFSGVFRQETQGNLLVGDNVTRTYDQAVWPIKEGLANKSWGRYRNFSWKARTGWLP